MLGLLSLTTQAESLNDGLVKCTKIQNSSARLGCFDELASSAIVSTVTSKKSANVVLTAKAEIKKTSLTSKANDEAIKAANFGVEHLKHSTVANEDLQIVFTIDKLSKDQYGKWRITFKNGQQWKQMDSTFLKIKLGDSVLLKKGFMNAVYLKKNQPDSNKKINIKRLK